MALIALCCNDTEENQRTKYTKQTIDSLLETVDLNLHSLVLVDNNSCQKTKDLLDCLLYTSDAADD